MKRRDSQSQRPESAGFTVIELAAALAVTALMVALAVSAARTYVVRAQIAESVADVLPLQHAVVQMFRATGVPPAALDTTGLVSSLLEKGTPLAAIDVVDGRIELKFSSRADAALAGRALSLTPFETADLQVVWVCGHDAPGIGLQPLGFSAGSRQAVQVVSTIETRFLPQRCR